MEEEHLQLNSEDEAHFVEEARLKSEQEDQACLKAEEDAHLVKYASQESKEHDNARLKVKERVRLALEVRWRAEEDYLRLKDEEARLKSEAEEKAHLKA